MRRRLTSDILAYICDTLANGTDPTDWHTLPALARTCKAFFEPAIDELWHDLPDLSILVFLMPTDAWRTDEGETHWGQPIRKIVIRLHPACSGTKTDHFFQSLLRDLVPSDLARFHIYTPRVRKPGDFFSGPPLNTRQDYMLDERALAPLLRVLPEHGVLPNLRQLELNYRTVPVLSALLGPSVEVITLRIEKEEVLEDTVVLAALREIPRTCPGLLQLAIHSEARANVFLDAITDIIPALQTIEAFDMTSSPIPLAALQVLAVAPSLKKLDVLVEFDDTVYEELAAYMMQVGNPFSKLVDLTLGVAAPEHAFRLLAFISSNHLNSVTIRYSTAPNEEQVKMLFIALTSGPHGHGLHRVSIFAPLTSASAISTWKLTNSTLEPLLVLRALRTLEIAYIVVDVDDEGLRTMAMAWPDLVTLSLGTQRWGSQNAHQPRATILGLLPFIQHCPGIETIGYRMVTDILHADEEVEPEDRPGQGFMTDRALGLCVGDSRIHDPFAVTAFLSDICPKLRYISHSWRTRYDIEDEEDTEADVADEEDMDDKWESVMEFLPLFVQVRKQERAHWRKQSAQNSTVVS